jgi:hypothetical protein
MILREFMIRKLNEGGNLEVDGTQAQQIDLKVHNRAYIVPILDTLLNSINNEFQQSTNGPLWNPKVLKSKKYLSGSSLHFFNTDIPDEEFERVKPKVGDIDTQVNKAVEPQLAQWLSSVKGQVVGNAKFLGYSRGNEQYSSLWELTDPPIKVQIDFEFVDYGDKDQPTDWAGFSHSSSWDDLSQGIKGVFHKFLITALAKISSKDFILRKVHKKTGKVTDKPERDSMLSFAVSSKEGGGLRPKYEPVLDDAGNPIEINGLPVLRELPPSGYEKNLSKIFQSIFGERIDNGTLVKLLPKTWSFIGLLEIMNLILSPEEKEQVLDAFVDKIFAPGAQGLYKGDPDRDLAEKNAALNYALKTLGITPPKNLEQMRQEYRQNYKVTTEGPVGLDNPIDEAEGDNPTAVKAQLRKGMPHLRDLKAPDFLDLLDEIHDGNGRFKLQNIPLNVKIDGFGGRFGKNAEGRPFMGTSRTEPRYEPGFVAYHQKKGTTDPEILGRAELFDDLFGQMMAAINLVDSKLGKDFLVDKQVTCEVLFLPFATETDEGKLKFVGISYDKLPKGVQLALVPFRAVTASTGEELPNEQEVVKQLTSLGRSGGVMFIDNSLTQQDGLDVTEIINPIENLDALKQIVSDTAGKRDRASLQLKKEVEEKLQPIKIALEKAIDSDPNIIGKDMLGKDYEGIVINSRLGPIKVTSTQQKDIIAAKNAAKSSARTERPRGESKTAVVAIGSFIGHKGHEDLFKYTINKAKELGGDPYLFIGNAEGKDDPIPPSVKVQTWHKLYPEYSDNISTVQAGGSLIQKIKHELINPLPGKPPRYDNIVIMVGEDRAGLTMPAALMKAVNKFQGYEHVKVSLGITPRESGFSGTMLRNSLKNDTPEKALATWSNAFDVGKLGKEWILHLMDITRKGMGIQEPAQPTQQPAPVPVAEMRLFNSLIRPSIMEISNATKASYKEKATAQVKELEPWTKKGEYKDIAKRAVQRREKGLEKVKDVEEVRMSSAVKLQRAMDRERSKSDASRRRGEEVMAQARVDWEKKQAAEKNKEQTVAEISLGNVLPWPAVANKISSTMKAMGWKVHRKGDDAFMFSTKGAEDESQYYMVMIDNEGNGMFSYALGTFEGGRPDIGEQDTLPTTEASVSEVIMAIRDGYGLNEQGVAEKMLPKSTFAGTKVGQKVGSAGQWKNTGPKKNKPARAGDLVGDAEESIEREEKQRLDSKCWTGYRKAGTKMKGGVRVNNCVPVSEDVEKILATLINKIIVNEAIQNKHRK